MKKVSLITRFPSKQHFAKEVISQVVVYALLVLLASVYLHC